eukprot:SAG11_NODE_1137_length_5726_cov_8.585747_4_plen_278_part_00
MTHATKLSNRPALGYGSALRCGLTEQRTKPSFFCALKNQRIDFLQMRFLCAIVTAERHQLAMQQAGNSATGAKRPDSQPSTPPKGPKPEQSPPPRTAAAARDDRSWLADFARARDLPHPPPSMPATAAAAAAAAAARGVDALGADAALMVRPQSAPRAAMPSSELLDGLSTQSFAEAVALRFSGEPPAPRSRDSPGISPAPQTDSSPNTPKIDCADQLGAPSLAIRASHGWAELTTGAAIIVCGLIARVLGLLSPRCAEAKQLLDTPAAHDGGELVL